MPSSDSIGVVTICRPAQEFSERLSVGVLGVAIGGEVGAQSAEFSRNVLPASSAPPPARSKL